MTQTRPAPNATVRIWLGCDLIARDVPVHMSINGVKRALAERLTRVEYRRAFRGTSPAGYSMTVMAGVALVETRNDDGTRGPTYTLVEDQ